MKLDYYAVIPYIQDTYIQWLDMLNNFSGYSFDTFEIVEPFLQGRQSYVLSNQQFSSCFINLKLRHVIKKI